MSVHTLYMYIHTYIMPCGGLGLIVGVELLDSRNYEARCGLRLRTPHAVQDLGLKTYGWDGLGCVSVYVYIYIHTPSTMHFVSAYVHNIYIYMYIPYIGRFLRM